MRVYAIGDIHGQLDMLRAAHARISEDRERIGDADAKVVHLGDYTDRGPDSAGVIDHLITGKNAGEPWVFLKGNHDRIFLRFLQIGASRDHILRRDLTWLSQNMGGLTTLQSYGVKKRLFTSERDLVKAAQTAIPESHEAFLSNLELSFETPDLYFCHAGVRPGVPLSEQVEDDLIWIRSPFLESTLDHGKIVVHGHTPVAEPEHYGNRIDIDTGAGYNDRLTAAVFEGPECFVLTEEGRASLKPYPTGSL